MKNEMNEMNEIPTPESDASTFDPYTWNQSGPGRSCSPEVMYQIDDGEWVHVDKMRDLERRLTIARGFLEDLEAAGVEGGVEDDDHHMTRIRESLKLTAPKQ